MKQTAVEWLLEKITLKKVDNEIYCYPTISIEFIEQAKEMEKEQMIDAFWGGLNGSINDYSVAKQVGSEIIDIKYGKGAEQYYNQTFKK